MGGRRVKIQVIGLGAGDITQLPYGIYQKLIQTKQVIYVRTSDHPVITQLKDADVTFESFDFIYEQYDQFDKVYEHITRILLEKSQECSVIYAVPGHPMIAEKTVQLLLEQDKVDIEIVGGQSFLDDLFTSLHIDPVEGFQLIDATSIN